LEFRVIQISDWDLIIVYRKSGVLECLTGRTFTRLDSADYLTGDLSEKRIITLKVKMSFK